MTFAAVRSRLFGLVLIAGTVLVGSVCGAGGYAQTPAPPQDARIGSLIEMLGRTRVPTQAQISPDGATVAWSVQTPDGSQIHLTSVADPDPAKERIAGTGTGATGCDAVEPRWSPDGASLAFLSNCTAEAGSQQQVFLWSAKTGEARQLTHLTGNLDSLAWSPDGKAIAFLFVENATRKAGALDAMKPWSGVIGEEGIEVQRVGMVDAASGTFAQVTPATLHIYEFDWAPDSRHLAFIAANPPGENNWWVAQLYTRDMDRPTDATSRVCPTNGECYHLKSILDPQTVSGSLHGLQIAEPRWSPDGKQIAFIGGLMSDQGVTGGDVYLVPSAGGEPKDVTPGRKASVAYLGWVGENALGIVEYVGGSTHLTALDLSTGQDVTSVDQTIPGTIQANDLPSSVSLADNKTVALVMSSFEHPPEVWAGPVDDLKQITHLNDGLKPLWGKTEDVAWQNEGFKAQGWLLYPAHYDPAKKYPLIVYVHGGPAWLTRPGWPGVNYGGVPFSARGYFVFMPNPRGSFGQGETFTQANVKDFGYGDLRDILAGMDTLENRLPIDKTREGLTGWSYGGFMTMFAVTQTTRFRAAVAGAGISDWKSYYGENSIDQWMIPFFGKSVYDDPAVYAKSSAINFIKNAKTPTLIVVGDRDGECPAPQSFEFWHGLRAQGVKTELVVYPDEGHSFSKPEHQRDVLERALRWFEVEMPVQ